LAQGTQLREKESGFVTPTTCFEHFPVPGRFGIAAAPVRARTAQAPSHRSAPESLRRRRHFYSAKGRRLTVAGSRREEAGSSTDVCRLLPQRLRDDYRAAIAAAKELNELRERWLNPPEWTRTDFLEFPASDGPWARYVECGDLSPLSPLATRRQRRQDKSATKSRQVGALQIGLPFTRLVPKDADCA
jgi:hypothetical protein